MANATYLDGINIVCPAARSPPPLYPGHFAGLFHYYYHSKCHKTRRPIQSAKFNFERATRTEKTEYFN